MTGGRSPKQLVLGCDFFWRPETIDDRSKAKARAGTCRIASLAVEGEDDTLEGVAKEVSKAREHALSSPPGEVRSTAAEAGVGGFLCDIAADEASGQHGGRMIFESLFGFGSVLKVPCCIF